MFTICYKFMSECAKIAVVVTHPGVAEGGAAGGWGGCGGWLFAETTETTKTTGTNSLIGHP